MDQWFQRCCTSELLLHAHMTFEMFHYFCIWTIKIIIDPLGTSQRMSVSHEHSRLIWLLIIQVHYRCIHSKSRNLNNPIDQDYLKTLKYPPSLPIMAVIK